MSTYADCAKGILAELNQTLTSIPDASADAFADAVLGARRVFCAGAGRSGFQIRGFAMRLTHMGLTSFVVGETCTPSIQPGDALVILSGSGATKSLVNHASKAKEMGASLLLVTGNPECALAAAADCAIAISTPSLKTGRKAGFASMQPMGNLFEQTGGLLLDAVIIMMMERQGVTQDEMFARHANME